MMVMAGQDEQRQEGASQSGSGRKSFDELLKAFDTLQENVSESLEKLRVAPQNSAAPSAWDRFTQFTTSGLFFMTVGMALLVMAELVLDTTHASFSFVLVVIGVAVLLFGTGTQGVGHMETTGYKVAIAGGAGAIAFCVGLGTIHYADAIKTVFQAEKKYIRIVMMARDGSSDLTLYAAAFSVDGVAIPSAKHSDFVEAFIPYFASDWTKDIAATPLARSQFNSNLVQECEPPVVSVSEMKKEDFVKKTVRVAFHRFEPKDSLRQQLKDVWIVSLRRSAMSIQNNAFDIPFYPVNLCIDLSPQQ
jgi:hypothetical protein